VSSHDTAFVLGGGGLLGANEVGMLRALLEEGVRPDLVVGTSVGAINGAAIAADPSPSAVDKLIARQALDWPEIRRLMTVSGVNLICAASFLAAIGEDSNALST